MEVGPFDFEDERDRLADLREKDADHREADADQRERLTDARERVLDRWERELAERALALDLLDPIEEERRRGSRARRAHSLEQRRADAEVRRDATIDRDIASADRVARSDDPSRERELAGDYPSEAFTRLAEVLQENPPFEDVIELVLTIAVETVPACDGASVALAVDGRLQSAASTVAWAAALDAAQIEHGGPLRDAAAGGLVHTPELRSDERWPALKALPASNSRRAAMSFGLVVGDTGHGVLTLYSQAGTTFGESAQRLGEMLAAHVAVAMRRTQERLTYLARADAWERALASRDTIGQAKGILMEQQRVLSADEAFDLLRATSQGLNVKLREVAEQVVNERRLPEH